MRALHHNSHHTQLAQAWLWCVVVCASFGCTRAAGDVPAGCDEFVAARAEVEALVSELEAAPSALPREVLRYPTQMEKALVQFAELEERVSAAMESMHENYEVPCKWPMIEDDNFEGVLAQVYDPHAALVGRQLAAVRAVSQRLREAGPAEVVEEAAASFERLAAAMQAGLEKQIAVCEHDFDPTRCEAFRASIALAVGSKSVPIPGAPKPPPEPEQK